jgi:hypothetical protein
MVDEHLPPRFDDTKWKKWTDQRVRIVGWLEDMITEYDWAKIRLFKFFATKKEREDVYVTWIIR